MLRSTALGTLLVNDGCKYGNGNGSTTVNLPDFGGMFPIGQEASYPLASVGGESSHTLTTDEIPSHSHNGQHIPGSKGFSVPAGTVHQVVFGPLHGTGAGVGPTGGGLSHNNLPPYISINFIIYAGS